MWLFFLWVYEGGVGWGGVGGAAMRWYICRPHGERVAVCQGFGAQRDVASCRKRESGGKSKTGHLQKCQGSSPDPPPCPRQRKRPVSLCFYPPCVRRAALKMFSLLILLAVRIAGGSMSPRSVSFADCHLCRAQKEVVHTLVGLCASGVILSEFELINSTNAKVFAWDNMQHPNTNTLTFEFMCKTNTK